MTNQPDLPLHQPPRIAEWVTTLFLPADIAESVMGDLLEEFSALVITSGAPLARRWYRRQAVSTIMHAGADAFRTAPLLMLASVIGGNWLIGFATQYSVHAVQTFLDAHRVYAFHPDAYLSG
jgi:hypothetical protein